MIQLDKVLLKISWYWHDHHSLVIYKTYWNFTQGCFSGSLVNIWLNRVAQADYSSNIQWGRQNNNLMIKNNIFFIYIHIFFTPNCNALLNELYFLQCRRSEFIYVHSCDSGLRGFKYCLWLGSFVVNFIILFYNLF